MTEDKPIIIIMPPEQSPRRQYVPPKNGTVLLFSPDTDPEDALRAAHKHEDALHTARQPDPAAIREFLLAPPIPPEIHCLSPYGGYPDGRSRRRERREQERKNKKR